MVDYPKTREDAEEMNYGLGGCLAAATAFNPKRPTMEVSA